MFTEPFILILGFLFIMCIVYMHVDMSISKSSPSYLAKLQQEEVSYLFITFCNKIK